ncbi:MAG: putative quinol monooxygenase [Rhizobiaceae bacterium]|nr:putative quinol monooxygenase [Rhizobiaceae bacterium]
MENLPSGSFRLEGFIDVPGHRVDAVRAGLVDHIRLTREEAGCIFFEVTPSKDVPGRFLVSEAFVDEAAFKFHQERSGSSPWARVSEDIPRNFKTWTVE